MYNKEIAERYGRPISLDAAKFKAILQLHKRISPKYIERAKKLAEILLDYHNPQEIRKAIWNEFFNNFDTCKIVRFDDQGVDMKTILNMIREA